MIIPTLPATAARRALARAVIVRPGDVTGGEIRRLFGPGADLEVRRAPLCYLGDAGRPGRTYCDVATVHLQAGQVAVVEVAYHLPSSLLEWVAAGALRAAEQADRERHTARCHHHAGCRTLTVALDVSGGLDADLRALVADVEADNDGDDVEAPADDAGEADNDDGDVDRHTTARACGWMLHAGGSLKDAGQLARWARNVLRAVRGAWPVGGVQVTGTPSPLPGGGGQWAPPPRAAARGRAIYRREQWFRRGVSTGWTPPPSPARVGPGGSQ